MANRFTAWVPAATWAGLLYLLSALPHVPGPRGIPYGDKLGHFALYGILGALLAFGRRRSGGTASHLLPLAIGALYGLSDEWHQMFVPGRTPDPFDWFADLTGLLTGYTTVTIARGTDGSGDDTKGTA